MINTDLLKLLKRRTAFILTSVLILQSGFPVLGSVQDKQEQAEELSYENTSFISFPSRFEDSIPEGYEEQYYVFSLDNRCDVTASVTFDDSDSTYGAELLDSSMSRLGISRKRNGQRIVKKQLPAGTYFLRVFTIEEQQEDMPFTVSVQKLDLSDSAVRKTDFSELHMVAALQGSNSPYQMNGSSPYYTYERYGNDSLSPYFWEKLASPSYSGRGVSSGGTYPMPQSYYSSWLGPVEEEALSMDDIRDISDGESYDEYDQYLQEEGIVYEDGHEPLLHVQNGIALPARYSSIDSDGIAEENPGWDEHLKNAIMTYGGVTAGIYWSTLECEKQGNYYFNGWEYYIDFDENGQQFYILANNYEKGNLSHVNHEVVIVGWDDDYSKENFRYSIYSGTVLPPEYSNENVSKATESDAHYKKSDQGKKRQRRATDSDADNELREDTRTSDDEMKDFLDSMLPEEDGAWIVRNSWGEEAGDGGYYYVSYCDDRLVSIDNAWAFEATEVADNYNKMYQVTNLPYNQGLIWETREDILMESTVFTADEEGEDLLKAVSFDLLTGNIHYEIAVNQGDDVGKGWIEENVYASGNKMYAGYYTVRLDKTILLQPGERFEIILKLENEGSETLAIPMVMNNSKIANIPQKEGICRLYDPEYDVEEWLDMGTGYMEDNGGSNYYAYFSTKALCEDISLEEGKIERITAIETDPDTYYSLKDSDSEPDESGQDNIQEYSDDVEQVFEGHILKTKDSSALLESYSEADPDIALPESFDLREVGVLTPVRDQRFTNTCWAFGSTAAVESSYLLNGSNLYDFNYSSAVSLDTRLPIFSDGTVVYYFDENDPDTMDDAGFTPLLLSWDSGPVEDYGGKLKWEFSGDLSAVDFSELDLATDGTRMTQSGEETLLFTPKESGIITVKVSSTGDPTKTAACKVVLVEDNSVDEIRVYPETMRLKVGSTDTLHVEIEGPDSQDVTPVFSSDNSGIASVDDRGTVIGLRRGTTVIRVRAGGKEATCKVTVWNSGGSGGGSENQYSLNPSGDSGVKGTWSIDENGYWSFYADGNTYRDSWGYLYNPYADQGKGDSGWFRFDAEGRMITGWYHDSDGHIYYLNPKSGGSLGKMLTGWNWISDSSGLEYCYYFYPDSGSPMGAMSVDTMTPDGFNVDEQGRWCVNGVPQTRTELSDI